MRIPFKIGDSLVYLLIILLVLGSFLGLYHMRVTAPYARLIIELDGRLVGTYPLLEGTQTQEVTVDAGDGRYNIIEIIGGEVTIREANCPDQICVKWGKVQNPGQTIVCLPHRVVVKIIGDKDKELPLDDIAS